MLAMNKQTEALKMAIEAMAGMNNARPDRPLNMLSALAKLEEAIIVCKEALEQPAQLDLPQQRWSKEKEMIESWQQPAQEPVAWMKNAIENARDVCKYLDHDMVEEAKGHTEFFWSDLDKIREFEDTHPAPSFIGLSDDEITNLEADHDIKVSHDTWEFDVYGFARAIETILKEKNGR